LRHIAYRHMQNLRKYTLTTLFSFLVFGVAAQNPKLADSLKNVYRNQGEVIKDLELLSDIAAAEANPDSIFKYSNLLIKIARSEDSTLMLHNGYLQKGNAYRLKGVYDKALKEYFISLRYAIIAESPLHIAKCNIEIGNVYSLNGNSSNAEIYYGRGIKILRESEDSITLAGALFNAGDEYLRSGKIDSAKIYTKESEAIFRKKGYNIGRAYSLGNLGTINAKMGNHLQAEENLNDAITLLRNINAYDAVSEFLISLANVYSENGDDARAKIYAERALEAAHTYGFKNSIAEANLKLSELYEKTKDTSRSFRYYKDYITYRDSFRNIRSIREMADLRTDFEVSQKQAEVDLLSQQKRYQKNIVIAIVIACFLLLLLAFGLYRRNRFIRRTKLIIEREKNRSEHLLLNILPAETAQELKETGKVKAKKFNAVSVLFTDFVGFTHYAENLPPEDLVATVDLYFSKFDKIVEKYGLEKIKTIGDAYMCAGGVPFPLEDHATKIINAAIEMLAYVESAKMVTQDKGASFDIRIGINSGPLIAGVVGSKKFAYDIWGDTVNMASRMESCSETGKINISQSTYLLVKDKFQFEDRGILEVKNKGMVQMYFVSDKRAENSAKIDNSNVDLSAK